MLAAAVGAPAAGASGAAAVAGPAAAACQVGPVTGISACGGRNAEVEQAVDAQPGYAYEEWTGCRGIAFARSTDGGPTWDAPVSLPGTAGSNPSTWDPAVAAALTAPCTPRSCSHAAASTTRWQAPRSTTGKVHPVILADPAGPQELGRPGFHRGRRGRHRLPDLGLRPGADLDHLHLRRCRAGRRLRYAAAVTSTRPSWRSPGLAGRIDAERTCASGSPPSRDNRPAETSYAITSLTAGQARPAGLAGIMRGR